MMGPGGVAAGEEAGGQSQGAGEGDWLGKEGLRGQIEGTWPWVAMTPGWAAGSAGTQWPLNLNL